MQPTDQSYLVHRFRDAVERGHIQAFFQPVIRSVTGNAFCVETLARWFAPDGRSFSPAEFIPVLESAGLILELDMEILRQACVCYQLLLRRGTPVVTFSVNLSRRDFSREDFFERITEVVDAHAVPHEAVKLEITESLMIDEAESFSRILSRLQDAGFSIWLDDFGSGYSSLNVLQNYPFTVMKFDMFFLRNLSPRGRQLLASLISMAKSLGIHTLAEGVETEEQRKFLLDAGCEAQQGYYYSRPLSAADLAALIDRKGCCMEPLEEKEYWDTVGRLNFTSPNPLEEYVGGLRFEEEAHSPAGLLGGSIALVECSQNDAHYIYASDSYRDRIRDLGLGTVDGLEKALSDRRSHQYLMLRKLALDAIRMQTVQKMEYAYHDVYFRLKVLYLARKKGWAMLALSLSTFDSEQEVRLAREMLTYSSALFSTYALVVLFYPERNRAVRIYTEQNMPVYDQEQTMDESLRRFCAAEVEPIDQTRYLRFLDFSTMADRIEASPDPFIQSYFRMRWPSNSGKWHAARITRIPAFSEKAFLLTFQNVHRSGLIILDRIERTAPELL